MICYSYNEKSLGEAVRKQRGESTEGKRYAWVFFLNLFLFIFLGVGGSHTTWKTGSWFLGHGTGSTVLTTGPPGKSQHACLVRS